MYSILTPVLALVAWSLVMWLWLYATRIPAMRAAGISAARLREKSELDALPKRVRQVADNYNHLHEQPVVFYALAFYCHLAGTADSVNVTLAWAYVALRVAHSLFQALVNFVPVRWLLFVLSSLCRPGAAGLVSATSRAGHAEPPCRIWTSQSTYTANRCKAAAMTRSPGSFGTAAAIPARRISVRTRSAWR